MRQSPPKSKQHMGERVSAAIAIADRAAADSATVIQRVVARRAPKAMGYDIGITDEGVRKLRDGERKPSFQTLFRLMFADPEVARVVELYARRAQEPDFWSYDTQREVHRVAHDISAARDRR